MGRNSHRLIIGLALCLALALPGCVVFRTAGNAVGKGVRIAGEAIQAVVP